MLVAVLMVFVIFSFTGVAVLNVSYLSSSASMETVNNIKLQYEMESSINEALWRINSGRDSLVNYSSGGITTLWDPQLNILSVAVENYQMETEILLDLSSDTPFDRAISSNNPINTGGYTADVAEEHDIRQFDELPIVNYGYFLLNTAVVHHGNQESWSESSLQVEGIHIFLGNNLDISGLDLENSTLVFLGNDIVFSNDNIIKAPVPEDDTDAVPAVVLLNPYTSFNIQAGTHIEGAIYCAGQLNIEDATLTGPIVAKTINLTNDVDFIDENHPEYYRWTKGFGNKNDYDWPKHVARWRTAKWGKILS
ncbi:MAG: hypothetical protein ISR87_10480 [Candidatus Marinimicrobia bacterium]|nr:hypothetical protein [FCB group bacterium]MBL7025871.1 hypothetical protein [Candidatus Neomarinimicrobiota bacterium]